MKLLAYGWSGSLCELNKPLTIINMEWCSIPLFVSWKTRHDSTYLWLSCFFICLCSLHAPGAFWWFILMCSTHACTQTEITIEQCCRVSIQGSTPSPLLTMTEWQMLSILYNVKKKILPENSVSENSVLENSEKHRSSKGLMI